MATITKIRVIVDIDHGDQRHTETVSVSAAAMEAVRLAFNPFGLPRVTLLKALAAAFLTECGAVVDNNPNASDESREARKFAISASMWAVLGATKGLCSSSEGCRSERPDSAARDIGPRGMMA